ncbi:MAG: hypothetical protein ABI680_09190 [Chthoniobacteraceae bacterium]
MSKDGHEHPRLDTNTGQLIRRCLRGCHYYDDLIEMDYTLASERTIPVITFAHRPHDARSSCIAFLPATRTPHEDIVGLREVSVPLVFFVGADTREMWSLRSDGPRRDRVMPTKEVEQFFDRNRSGFGPGAIFRAKTWARAEGARQLDFVDTGLLPLVENEGGARLRQLFEEMVAHSMDALGMKPSSLSENDAQAGEGELLAPCRETPARQARSEVHPARFE